MIALTQNDNIGSIQKFEIVLQTDVESFAPVVLKSGKTWLEIEPLPETGSLRFSTNETDNGTLFNYAVAFKHSKLSQTTEDALDVFVGKRSVLKVTDMNDRVYIIGAPGLPCDFSYDGDTGNSPTEQNAYTINAGVAQTFRAKSA